MTSEFQDRLIQIALKKGYLSADRIPELLHKFEELHAKDHNLHLHEMLVDAGLLTRDQLVDVRREMAREGIAPKMDQFYILSRIGRGSMGTVYQAHDRSLDRPVALKLLATHLAADERFVKRFIQEARLAARISHPNVVQVFDVGQWRGTHYIVMEYVEGRTLERMVSDGPLNEPDALRISREIAAALNMTSSRNIVHRDIKPANILVRADGVAKLSDLGLAFESVESSAGAVGTPYYMSPEQARGETNLDVRSDIYSLGCTLFFAVTGKQPFEGKTAYETLRMHGEASRPDARALRPELSPQFAAILRKMMAIAPGDRYQSAQELKDALDRISAAAAPRRSESWLWGLGILMAIIALVLMFLAATAIISQKDRKARNLNVPGSAW